MLIGAKLGLISGGGLANRFVVFGDRDSSALVSPDGINWVTHTMPSDDRWTKAVWTGQKILFTTAASLTNQSAITSDMNTFQTGTNLPASSKVWKAVAWNEATFAAAEQLIAGTTGATSTDGITWTSRTVPAGIWRDMAYGAGLFVLVGNSGGVTICATSPDGITWTSRTIPNLFGAGYCIAWSGSEFVVGGETGRIARSTDGINWGSAINTGLGAPVQSITWDGAKFCAVATSGSSPTPTATSSNGTSWSTGSFASTWNTRGVAGNGSILVSVQAGSGTTYYTSTDGLSWTSRTLPSVLSNINGIICCR